VSLKESNVTGVTFDLLRTRVHFSKKERGGNSKVREAVTRTRNHSFFGQCLVPCAHSDSARSSGN